MEFAFKPIAPEHIPAIEPWFDDPQTQRFLGNRSWLYRTLSLVQAAPGAIFHGRRVLSRHIWVIYEGTMPVSILDVEPYDDGTAGVALVVAPALRGKGIGRRVLLGLRQRPELAEVRVFIGAVDPENTAAKRCVTRAGFEVAEQVDEEGMLQIRQMAV